MAKKFRQRTWYVGLFKKEADAAFLHRRLPAESIFFDKESLAYSYSMNERLKPLRDENGTHIVNDKGYAQLPDLGKLTVIGIKGSAMDWNNVEKAPAYLLRDMGISGDSVKTLSVMALNKQTLKTVLEESDEMFNRFAESPLAKAGGVIPIDIPEAEVSELATEL